MNHREVLRLRDGIIDIYVICSSHSVMKQTTISIALFALSLIHRFVAKQRWSCCITLWIGQCDMKGIMCAKHIY